MQESASCPATKLEKVSEAMEATRLMAEEARLGQKSVYAAAREAAYPLFLREHVDGDNEAEEGVHDGACSGRADVRGGVYDVALLEVGAEVFKDLFPIHGELLQGFYLNIEFGQEFIYPVDDRADIFGKPGGDFRHGLG